MKNLKITSLLGLLILVLCAYGYPQRYVLSSQPELKISGSSTLGAWEMASQSAKGTATIFFENNTLTKAENLKVVMPAESLKSGKSQMDSNAYKSLKTKQYPEIEFELIDLKVVGEGKLKAKGHMHIAGVKKLLAMNVDYKQTPKGVIFTGSTSFLLSEFKVQPPSMMMGAIKTDDKVELTFNVIFQNAK